MRNNYHLIFKTGQSEFRAWNSLTSINRTKIIPIVELTRGRKFAKKKGDGPDTIPRYDFDKICSEVKRSFGENEFLVLDVTREPSLISDDLVNISLPNGGYKNWIDFLVKYQSEVKAKVRPTIIVNPGDDDGEDKYISDIRQQFEALSKPFDAIYYRSFVIDDTDFVFDIAILKDLIIEYIKSGNEFFIVLDHEYIRPGTAMVHALRTISVVRKIRDSIPEIKFVVAGTSFPKSVTEIAGEDSGDFRAEELFLYDEMIRNLNKNQDIFYGDYGSINPVRNDDVKRGGWRPRIDFISKDRRFHYRRAKRLKDTPYSEFYETVAQNVIKDPAFQGITSSWGVEQILKASSGLVPSSSPSFWISVRMEIYLTAIIDGVI